MMDCIHCHSKRVRKNGHIHNGKQNYYCTSCSRQFVEGGQEWFVDSKERSQIDKLLLERISLRGICRVMGVSLSWLLGYINEYFTSVIDEFIPLEIGIEGDLLVDKLYSEERGLRVEFLGIELDELWSFVGNKDNKQWVWLALNPDNRQIIAIHIGGRGREDADLFYEKIPTFFKKKCCVFF
jgi:insertion element IS1 protein InsB